MENDPDYVRELSAALLDRDAFRLRELSDQCSDAAFINPDKKTIDVGIISYAFHKILLKRHYQSKFGPLLSDTLNSLDTGDLDGIIENVKEFDRQYGFFQGNVIKKARIKIGARLYTRGLSLARAAELVSVNISDILKYSGGTQVNEKGDGRPLQERLDTARKLFE
jgi:hypothetical protein